MALKLDDLRRLVDSVNFRYFVDPRSPTLMCGVQGRAGSYQMVMSLQIDGRFLQFRTISYMHAAADHQHTAAVLRALAEINYVFRFTKFGWDPKDGEIVVYGDVWLMDAGLTESQFKRLLNNFLSSIDEQYARLSKTAATGTDPGPTESATPKGDVETL